ncbi:MAG: CRTAC1 family protein, partial [Bacteroidota bacterium]
MTSPLTQSGLIGALCFLMASVASAQVTFTNISSVAGIDHVHVDPALMGGGAALFDADGDGDLDLYLTGGDERDALYRNDDGAFTEIGASAGLSVTDGVRTMGVVSADVDNDGDRDLYVTTSRPVGNLLLRNNGDGTFTDDSEASGARGRAIFSTSATFGDVNLDGWVDLYVQGYVEELNAIRNEDGEIVGFAHECFADALFINDGDGTFTERTTAYGINEIGCGLATTFADYDGDSDPDLFVINDFGAWVEPNGLLRNETIGEGQARFTDVSAAAGAATEIYGMGIARSDFDRDGDWDYYMTNMGANVLLERESDGFVDTAEACGVLNAQTTPDLLSTGWGTAFADLDHDGFEELLVANGHMPAAPFLTNDTLAPDKLYHNNADGTFSDASESSGFASTDVARGLATGDIDGDGDLDVVVAVVDGDGTGTGRAMLYRNDTAASGAWLSVRLRGVAATRDGIGARVEAFAGSNRWVREVAAGDSYLSQSASTAHFGLGAVAQLDSLVVTWPGGRRDKLEDVATGQTLLVTEGVSTDLAPEASPQALSAEPARPNPVRGSATIAYQAAAPVTLRVYDTLGREIAVQHAERPGAGRFVWKARAANGSPLASGVYVYT